MIPLPAPIEAFVERQLRVRGTRGLALCAFDRQSVLWSGGVGYARLESGQLATPRTVFKVASISKLLTTTLALRLADEGLLDLDAPINDHLPADLRVLDRSGRPASSSLASLLSHSSGLPAGIRGVDAGNPVLSLLVNQGRVDGLASAIRGLRLAHEPEDRVVYSNPAFNVVGFVAARVAGGEFEDVAAERVLRPLDMDDSAFASHRTGPEVATQYGSLVPLKTGSRPLDGFRLLATPMGGLTSTAPDLARFGQMVLGEGRVGDTQLLPPDLLRRATTVRATNHPDLEQGYGLGFKVRPWRGRTVVGHDGNMPGVATQLLLSPSDGVGVVVLTNGFALSVPHMVAMLALEHVLGLPPVAHGAPGPVDAAGGTEAWERFGRRVEGSYRLVDAAPPGVVGRLDGLVARVRVAHEARGRLRVDGHPGSDGSVWLHPEAGIGRYRSSSGVDDGATAVIEERADGPHLWLGFANHLRRR